MNKKLKVSLIVVKSLFTILVLMGALQYFFNHSVVEKMFEQMLFPTYLIYPMGIAKLLGIATIWLKLPKRLKEWAYAGFFFNFILGISAHVNVNDGEYFPAIIALVFVTLTYILDLKNKNI